MMLKLQPKQKQFVRDINTPYIAYVGGFRAGKTISLVAKAFHLSSLTPGKVGILMEPTFSMVKDALLPVINDMLFEWNLPHEIKTGASPEVTIQWEQGPCRILLRSAENHKRLRGITAAWAGVDEIDTIDEDLVDDAWVSITSRVSHGDYRQKFVTTTPEGFKWTYKFFEKEHEKDDRRLIRVSMRENPFLAPEYVTEQESLYEPRLAEAYIDGHFVNLTTGIVYYAFDRKVNRTTASLKDFPEHTLHIGQDFNVNHNCSIVHIVCEGVPIAVDEITDIKNTEETIKEIKRRYGKRRIMVYPDSSGKNESSNAGVSDIIQLKNAGFIVKFPKKNPPVRNRVASVNSMFRNSKGEIRYKVNTEKCPKYTESLEMQSYDKRGKPEKRNDIDHPTDAAGYFIHFSYPLQEMDQRRVTIRNG